MGHNSSNFKLWKNKPGSEMHHIWGQKQGLQITVGTWNVNTLYSTHKVGQVASEMHDISHTSAWSTIRHVLEWNPRRNEDAVTYS